MSSLSHKPSSSSELEFAFLSLPQAVLLQFGTGSMLGVLLGARVAARTMQTLGQVSEEVFRGDRLPILNFPIDAKIAARED